MLHATESILLLGDRDGHVLSAITAARPDAMIVRADNIFDGIAELHGGPFSAVVAAVEPIERRPEPAVRAIRQLVGDKARVLLYGNTTLEPLSRKMLGVGVDDYFVTPADPAELRTIFATATPPEPVMPAVLPPAPPAEAIVATNSTIDGDGLLQVALDTLLEHPQASAVQLAKRLGSRMPRGTRLKFLTAASTTRTALAIPIRNAASVIGHLDLEGLAHDEPMQRALLARLAPIFTKVAALEERHALMQKLAITDDLTGLYNRRYFNHFLTRMLEKAKARRFAVTLLLFDIDNFKRYNDQFGHGVGDEILRQTATLMRKCCRDHDLVARIGGDEFAVVFWEKDAPRVPYDPNAAPHSRVPSTPMIIAQRFRKQLGSSEFNAIGPAGKGVLTISGGMAVYPFDGQTPAELIKAADGAQMFGAKKSGKNSIALVGEAGTYFAGSE